MKDIIFNRGDRVKVIKDVPQFIGQTGTVVCITSDMVVIELDKPYRLVRNLVTNKYYMSGKRYYTKGALEKC